MAGELRIFSPEEVKAQTKRITALLKLYQEGLDEEIHQLSPVGQQLEMVRHGLNRRHTELKTALESAERPAQSEAARKHQRTLEIRLSACEEQLQRLRQHETDYADICRYMSGARQKSQKLSDDGKLLSDRVGALLTKIIELT